MKKLFVLIFIFIFIGFCALQVDDFYSKLSNAAKELTNQKVTYDANYVVIKYPGGDVASNKGVCTDVIVRAYRKLGIDLQKEVHEDMVKNFNLYPKLWGLKKPDSNIDHRRVQNLMVYFSRFGTILPQTQNPKDYNPGDIVCWMLDGNLTHIGIVVDSLSDDKKRHQIVHNIGGGQIMCDCLFEYKIIGHYKYKK